MKYVICLTLSALATFTTVAASIADTGPDHENNNLLFLRGGMDLKTWKGDFGLVDPEGKVIFGGHGQYTPLASMEFNFNNNDDPKAPKFLNFTWNSLNLIDGGRLNLNQSGLNLRDALSVFQSGSRAYDVSYGYRQSLNVLRWLPLHSYHQVGIEAAYKQDDLGKASGSGRLSMELKMSSSVLTSPKNQAENKAALLREANQSIESQIPVEAARKARAKASNGLAAFGDRFLPNPSPTPKRISIFSLLPAGGFGPNGFLPNDVQTNARSHGATVGSALVGLLEGAPGGINAFRDEGTQPQTFIDVLVAQNPQDPDLQLVQRAARRVAQALAASPEVSALAPGSDARRAYNIRTLELLHDGRRFDLQAIEEAAERVEKRVHERLSLARFVYDESPKPQPDPKLSFYLQGFGWQRFTGEKGPHGYINARLVLHLPGLGAISETDRAKYGLGLSYIAGNIPSEVNKGLARFSLDLVLPIGR